MSQHIASSMLPSAPSVDARPAGGPATVNWLKRLLDAVVAGQEARARRVVRPHLARQSDEALRALGFTPDWIKALRAETGTTDAYWR